jgi:hypothetical protein
LSAGEPQAFLSRRVQVINGPVGWPAAALGDRPTGGGPAAPAEVAVPAPLRLLVREAYDDAPGYRINGALAPEGETFWGGVLLEPNAPPPPAPTAR